MTPARIALLHSEIEHLSACFSQRQVLHKELQQSLDQIVNEMNSVCRKIEPNVQLEISEHAVECHSLTDHTVVPDADDAHVSRRQQKMQCPAELAQMLCTQGVRVFQDVSQLEIAVANIAPAELRRQSAEFFSDLIPLLSSWLHLPQRVPQAFALLHEGVCLFPDCVVSCGHLTEIRSAIGHMLTDADILRRLETQARVQKSDVAQLHRFLSDD